MPSSPGNFRSSSTRSIASRSNSSNISRPELAALTRMSFLPRYSTTSSRTSGSSSTTRICGASGWCSWLRCARTAASGDQRRFQRCAPRVAIVAQPAIAARPQRRCVQSFAPMRRERRLAAADDRPGCVAAGHRSERMRSASIATRACRASHALPATRSWRPGDCAGAVVVARRSGVARVVAPAARCRPKSDAGARLAVARVDRRDRSRAARRGRGPARPARRVERRSSAGERQRRHAIAAHARRPDAAGANAVAGGP